MPISLRKKGKASNIAYTVLDSPLLSKKKKKKKQEQKLIVDECRRA